MQPLKTSLIILSTILSIFLFPKYGLTGDTTITGTMSCYIPNHIEFKTQGVQQTFELDNTPLVAGASGSYEIKKEEKTLPGVQQTENRKAVLYTICAK